MNNQKKEGQKTLEALYKELIQRLTVSDIESPVLDARLILMKTLKLSHLDFITGEKDITFSDEESKSVYQNLELRCQGMPVSRIFGEREFWGLPFFINEHCLDPRPDTETLVEAVVRAYKTQKNEPLRIVDFGTGSGCILISLLHEFPNATGLAIDISTDALLVAQKNAQILGVEDRMDVLCSDWTKGLNQDEMKQFDIIVSNPPYIESGIMPDLPKEVIHYDPHCALDGGKIGLDPYKILIPQMNFLLKSKGKTFFEIGKGQESEIIRLVENTDATLEELHRDLSGIIRVVEISCGDK